MDIAKEQYFACPYCGSENSIVIDYSAGMKQEFLLDCEVCCRPIIIALKIDGKEVTYFQATKENE